MKTRKNAPSRARQQNRVPQGSGQGGRGIKGNRASCIRNFKIQNSKSKPRSRAERGQAMLETILLVALVGLVLGVALRAVGLAYAGRREAMHLYYSIFVP